VRPVLPLLPLPPSVPVAIVVPPVVVPVPVVPVVEFDDELVPDVLVSEFVLPEFVVLEPELELWKPGKPSWGVVWLGSGLLAAEPAVLDDAVLEFLPFVPVGLPGKFPAPICPTPGTPVMLPSPVPLGLPPGVPWKSKSGLRHLDCGRGDLPERSGTRCCSLRRLPEPVGRRLV
jgi:hypothetical protein